MTKKKKNKRGKRKHDISTAKLEPASIKEKRGVIQKIKEFFNYNLSILDFSRR